MSKKIVISKTLSDEIRRLAWKFGKHAVTWTEADIIARDVMNYLIKMKRIKK